MIYRRGDIVLVLFPDSNQRTAKRRPALVIQADGLETGLQHVVVAMITSQLNRIGHRSRVAAVAADRGGLLMDSVIMTNNLATIHHFEIDRVIGQFARMDLVDTSLRATLGL